MFLLKRKMKLVGVAEGGVLNEQSIYSCRVEVEAVLEVVVLNE